MPIHTRNHDRREPRQKLRGIYREYETRTCNECRHTIRTPKGENWPCIYCERLKDSRITRRAAILAILETEQVTMEQALEFWTELAEIDQALQFKPADLVIEEFPY